MSTKNLLFELKELAEGRRTLEEWEQYRLQHLAEIEARFSRLRCQFLKIRPLVIAKEILAEYGVPCRQTQLQCRECGGLIFRLEPGERTEAEIVEFAARSTLPNRERILKTGWMAPGLYCLKGCTRVIWRLPCELTPAEELLRAQERAEAEERSRMREAAFQARWGGKVCVQCGKSVMAWGDTGAGRCGFCQHPLEASPVE